MCVDLAQFNMGTTIVTGQTVGVWPCSSGFSQAWTYNTFGQLQSRAVSSTCLEATANRTVTVSACNQLRSSQVWIAQGILTSPVRQIKTLDSHSQSIKFNNT
jgi:hypothetical protein